MGLRLEVYNENYVGLVADFNFVENSKEFCTSNNIEEAMEYFDLYLDERTRRLKRNDPNQRIVDKLAINIENIANVISNRGACCIKQFTHLLLC